MDVVKLCNSFQNKVRLTSIEDHDPQALHTPAKGLSLCLLFCGEITEKDGCLPVTTNFLDSILVYSFFSDVNIGIISFPLDTGVVPGYSLTPSAGIVIIYYCHSLSCYPKITSLSF